ncbi:hypothetical protein KIMH_10450 [Bombiscardovia apis]|uniref:GPI inositol-deacylase PGAP1-like alpha/beta domain-containing protein n=1 Tax=Bombiscardovia apis TaxID=2932182 RepID=A0ABN6SFZ1_9BIFI|nr:Mbeg1-like protein [Bombiscardovia apis]BDR54934.1 hypothetical protein KIMH_10450 [Bombiscardovia apis]
MSKRVSSSLSDQGFSQADLQAFSGAADALNQAGADLANLGNDYARLGMHMTDTRVRLTLAPCRVYSQQPPQGHARIAFEQLISSSDECRDLSNRLSRDLQDTAKALITAYSSYSGAENRMLIILSGLKKAGFRASPVLAGGASLGIATVSSAFDSIRQGRGGVIDPYDVIHKTRGTHQDFMDGLAHKVAANKHIGSILGQGGAPTRGSKVNDISSQIAALTAPRTRLKQGNQLEVKRVEPQGTFLGSAHSIDQALGNLSKLGQGGQGIEYSTVAVQKYRHTDGSIGWVVTIPGTNNYPDSPIGWEQNLELMSNSKDQRMQAASARLVAQAMREAGIKPQDSVALVGHSQGGIVAATVAADCVNQYRIDHVVSAGSPIGNHPVPSRTWVTSVEMDDEIVSSLEGNKNPRRDNWLTVRGNVSTVPKSLPTPGHTPVPGAADTGELSHGMNYQRAAWQNAASQGKPSQVRHDRHFAQISEGELEETDYYQGRMKH